MLAGVPICVLFEFLSWGDCVVINKINDLWIFSIDRFTGNVNKMIVNCDNEIFSDGMVDVYISRRW